MSYSEDTQPSARIRRRERIRYEVRIASGIVYSGPDETMALRIYASLKGDRLLGIFRNGKLLRPRSS